MRDLGLGLIIGLLVMRIWSDALNAYRWAHDQRHEPFNDRVKLYLGDLIPRWAVMLIIAMGAVIVLVGGLQVWQGHQQTIYQNCTGQRVGDSIAGRRALYDWLKTAKPLFSDKDPDPAQVKAFNDAYAEYISHEGTFFDTVDESNSCTDQSKG